MKLINISDEAYKGLEEYCWTTNQDMDEESAIRDLLMARNIDIRPLTEQIRTKICTPGSRHHKHVNNVIQMPSLGM